MATFPTGHNYIPDSSLTAYLPIACIAAPTVEVTACLELWSPINSMNLDITTCESPLRYRSTGQTMAKATFFGFPWSPHPLSMPFFLYAVFSGSMAFCVSFLDLSFIPSCSCNCVVLDVVGVGVGSRLRTELDCKQNSLLTKECTLGSKHRRLKLYTADRGAQENF